MDTAAGTNKAVLKGVGAKGRPSMNVKWPEHIVLRALLLHKRGYGAADIRRHLQDEGYVIPDTTLRSWLNGRMRISQ